MISYFNVSHANGSKASPLVVRGVMFAGHPVCGALLMSIEALRLFIFNGNNYVPSKKIKPFFPPDSQRS